MDWKMFFLCVCVRDHERRQRVCATSCECRPPHPSPVLAAVIYSSITCVTQQRSAAPPFIFKQRTGVFAKLIRTQPALPRN